MCFPVVKAVLDEQDVVIFDDRALITNLTHDENDFRNDRQEQSCCLSFRNSYKLYFSELINVCTSFSVNALTSLP